MIGVFYVARRTPPPVPQEKAPETAKAKLTWFTVAPLVLTIGANVLIFESIKARHGMLSLWVLVLILPVLMVSTAIHEAGHLLMALRGRSVPDLFMVGPLAWRRLADGQWVFRFLPKAHGWLGGRVNAIPVDAGPDLRRRLEGILWGGPGLQFAASLMALVLFLWIDPARHPWWAHTLGFGLLGMVSAVINLFPIRAADGDSDGAQLERLRRAGAEREAVERSWLIDLPFVTRRRFADLDVGPPLDASDGDYRGNLLARYYQALDLGDIHAAGKRLDSLWAISWPSHDRWVACEAAWFEARYRGNAAARGLLAGPFHGYPVDAFVALRAEAAVCVAEGKLEEAFRLEREALGAIERCPETGWTMLNRDLLAAPGQARHHEAGLVPLAASLAATSGAVLENSERV